MKNLFKILAFMLIAVIAVPLGLNKNLNRASAVGATSFASATEFSGTVGAILSEYSELKNRIPGSEGEKLASEYISNYLNSNTTLVAVNNTHIKNGVQSFDFECDFTNTYKTSQNIIFRLNSSIPNTTKKVIIGCHYDAVAFDMDTTSETYGDFIDSASINGSAGNVATLLAIAQYFPTTELNFNIEFVFFGAGESSNAGSSYYAKGISKEDKENVLCMINVDQVALGQNLYFYMNEIETKSSIFVSDVNYENRIDIEKVNLAHLNKSYIVEESELGLNYSHIALQSDNVSFMKENIETINIFAGDYSNGIVMGRCEFTDFDLLTYTANDNIEYILNTFKEYSIEGKLYEVYKMVCHNLTDFDFVSVFDEARGGANWFLKLFGNQTLVIYLTVIVFIIFVMIAMYIYYKLSIKAYHANIELEFLSSVVKITDSIDKTGKDENVAKVVSQVIANDIKKDKVIKGKPPKNDKKD